MVDGWRKLVSRLGGKSKRVRATKAIRAAWSDAYEIDEHGPAAPNVPEDQAGADPLGSPVLDAGSVDLDDTAATEKRTATLDQPSSAAVTAPSSPAVDSLETRIQISLAELVRRYRTSDGLALSAAMYDVFERSTVREFIAGSPPRNVFLGLLGFGTTKFGELQALATAHVAADPLPARRLTEFSRDAGKAETPLTKLDAIRPPEPVRSKQNSEPETPPATGQRQEENFQTTRDGERSSIQRPARKVRTGEDASSEILTRTTLADIAMAFGSARLRNRVAETDLFDCPVSEFRGDRQDIEGFLAIQNFGRVTYGELAMRVGRYCRQVAAGEDPLGLLGPRQELRFPEQNSEAGGTEVRLADVTLRELIEGSETSTRLANMIFRTELFDRSSVLDLLEGNLSEEEILSVPELGRTTLKELLTIAEGYSLELQRGFDRLAALEEIEPEQFEDQPQPEEGESATQLNGLTVADLSDHVDLPVRIANRLKSAPSLRNLPLSRIIADPEGCQEELLRLEGLGRRSIAELVELVRALAASPPLTANSLGELDESVSQPALAPRQAVEDALAALPEKQRFVVECRYGLAGAHPLTLDEVGKQVHVTRERVRQVEKKALQVLAKRPWRVAFEDFLAVEQTDAWRAISNGDAIVPDAELGPRSRAIAPLVLLAVDVVYGSVREWLDTLAVRGPGGWLPPGGSAEALRSAARTLKKALETLSLPRPFEEVSALAGLQVEETDAALTLLPDYRLSGGYLHSGHLGSKARRAARLHRLGLGGSTSNVIDVWKLAELDAEAEHTDDRSPRMVLTQLGENPHLFHPLFDHYWVVLPALGAWKGEPDALPSASEAALPPNFEPSSMSAWVYKTLEREGPMRHVDLRARAIKDHAGTSGAGIGPMLLMHPVFQRVAPGVFDIRRARPGGIVASLLSQSQCRAYAQALRSGAPRGYFSAWTAEFEWRLCEWARNEADGDVFRSLLHVSRPETWPTSEDIRRNWLRLRELHGSWMLSSERRSALGTNPPTPSQFVSGLAQLALLGSLGWFGAGRATQSALGAQGSVDLLAILVAAGLASSATDWQLPHEGTPAAVTVLGELSAELYLSGSLSWSSSPLSQLLDLAEANAASVRWANQEEVFHLIACLRGTDAWAAGPVASGGAVLEGVEELFESDEWDRIFSE
jgi:RNA polymerase sigma factor (sigma-70 family)